MTFLLKLPIKILAIPFVLALILVNALLNFALYLTGGILFLLSFLFAVGGIYTLYSGGSTANGITALVMAFVVSPFGLPAIIGCFMGLLEVVKEILKVIILSW